MAFRNCILFVITHAYKIIWGHIASTYGNFLAKNKLVALNIYSSLKLSRYGQSIAKCWWFTPFWLLPSYLTWQSLIFLSRPGKSCDLPFVLALRKLPIQIKSLWLSLALTYLQSEWNYSTAAWWRRPSQVCWRCLVSSLQVSAQFH